MEEKTKKMLEYYNEKLLKKDSFRLKDTSSFSHPGYIPDFWENPNGKWIKVKI